MTRANPNAHAHLQLHWHVRRNRRLFVWDVTLVLAIILALGFVFMQTKVAGAFFDGRQPATQQESPPRSINGASVADLMVELKDPIPNVRVSAAEALGSRHAVAATDALLAATYDSDASVREEAAVALGDIGAIQAFPRLRELQVSGNSLVEIAAFEGEGNLTRDVAANLNLPRSSVQALTVAQNGAAYAAALNNFYTLQNGKWQLVSDFPAIPNDLSAGPDGRLIFMSTDSSGLYASQDSGKTWQHMQYGLQTPTQLKTTAVLVDPDNRDQVYAALAVNGSTGDLMNALGIVFSQDGGKTWSMLPNSPNASVTRALIIDRTTHRYLYGLSDVGPWGYQLPSIGADFN